MSENEALKISGVIQLRGGTKSAMEQVNPILRRREACVETDTGRMKVGDGEHAWNDLPYSGGSSSRTTENHTLTASEAEAKEFSLDDTIASGHENSTLLFVLGVLQVYGQDYEVSDGKVKWADKSMSELELREGDILQISYEKELQ